MDVPASTLVHLQSFLPIAAIVAFRNAGQVMLLPSFKIFQWILTMFEIKTKLCTLVWARKGTAKLPTPFLATLPFAYHTLVTQTIFFSF